MWCLYSRQWSGQMKSVLQLIQVFLGDPTQLWERAQEMSLLLQAKAGGVGEKSQTELYLFSYYSESETQSSQDRSWDAVSLWLLRSTEVLHLQAMLIYYRSITTSHCLAEKRNCLSWSQTAGGMQCQDSQAPVWEVQRLKTVLSHSHAQWLNTALFTPLPPPKDTCLQGENTGITCNFCSHIWNTRWCSESQSRL